MADYVINKDIRVFDGIDKFTGVRKVSFFNYYQFNRYKNNKKTLTVLETAVLSVFESRALRAVFDRCTNNPILAFNEKYSDLKGGRVAIEVATHNILLVVNFDKQLKNVINVEIESII